MPERIAAGAERLVFAPSVEALLLRGCAGRITPLLADQLRKIGIDIDKPLLPGYRSDVWQQAIDLVAAGLYPGEPMAVAQRKLGESTVYGWGDTLLGKAMFTVTKLYGPRRILLRFPTMSKSSNNYSSMEVTEVGAQELAIVCQPYEGWPEFIQGCLCAVASVAGAKEPQIEVIEHDKTQEEIKLRATWKS
jgi:uncharacterized protein (TIGR02265 family)